MVREAELKQAINALDSVPISVIEADDGTQYVIGTDIPGGSGGSLTQQEWFDLANGALLGTDGLTVDPNDTNDTVTYGLSNQGVPIAKIDGSGGTAGQVLHTDGTSLFWDADDTGTGSGTGDVYDVGPNHVLLVGGSYGTPSSGLLSTMQTEFDSGNTIMRITGHWTASGNFQYSSSNGTPSYTGADGATYDLPVLLDMRGAVVDHTGTGYAITDDSRPTTTGGTNLDGGHTEIYGGWWVSGGTPVGVFLGRDAANARIHLSGAHEYKSGGSAAIMEFRSEETWIEHNDLSCFYATQSDRLIFYNDTGTAPTSNGNNISFQDTYIGPSKLDRITNGGAMLDLNGNFVDSVIESPIGIAGSNGCCLIRHNTNMAGTSVYGPAFEKGGTSSYTVAMVNVAADGRQGPTQFGGKPGSDGTDWFDLSTAGGSWSWAAVTTEDATADGGRGFKLYNFTAGASQNTAVKMDGGGFKIGNASDPNATPTAALQFTPTSGDLTVAGAVNSSGAPSY